jgi:hypothetical protein
LPSDVALGPIYEALKTLLAAYAPLTTLIGVKPIGGTPGIYDDGAVPTAVTTPVAPATTWLPYLTIGAGTQVPSHTFGDANDPTAKRWGWNCTVQIKGIGQVGESAGLAIMSKVLTVVKEGTPLTLAGYDSAWCDESQIFPTIITTLAGVTTREWPVILRVYCSDQV